MGREGPSLSAWLAELKRRSVFRVAAAYAAVAFVLVQATAYVFDALLFPEWAHRLLVVLLLAGFPVALLLAWAFELTPEGLRPSVLLVEEGAESPGATGWLRPAAALLLVAAVGVAAAGTTWAAWNAWLGPDSPGSATGAEVPGSTPELPPSRVAVLYFDDHSQGQELGHIAKGLTEAVIHELTQVEELDVLSRNAVKPYRELDVPLDSVVRHLGAGSVVEGSVARTGSRYEATIQLFDGESLTHLMSERVQVSGEDPLDLRDAIVREAGDLLRRRLGEAIRLEAIRSETDSSEAWEYFHRADRLAQEGSELWRSGEAETARHLLERADSLFGEAERADPDWPLPTINRGWTALRLARLSGPEITGLDQSSLRSGIDLATRVVDRHSGQAAGYELRGVLRYALSRALETPESADLLRDAEADLHRAVELDPSRARAWLELAELLRSRGRFQQARAALRRSREADPFLGNDLEHLQVLAQLAVELEEYETAQRLVRDGHRLMPEQPFFPVLELNIYASPGGPRVSPDSAWSIVHGLEARFGRTLPFGHLQVAAVLARADLRDSAVSVVGRAREAAGETAGSGGPMLDYYEALTRLILGERDAALRLLSDYVEARPERRDYIASESWWKPLRGDPRFQRLVADEG